MKSETSKRLGSLDVIRVVALGLVFLIHGIENTWNITSGALLDMSIISRVAIMVLYTLGRLSVPLFLFLTGYLMLDRKYTKDNLSRFYKTKVLKLLTVTLIWTAIYVVFTAVVLGRTYTIFDIVKLILFLSPDLPNAHLWYMPTIVGIYIFLPFIANAVQMMNRKAWIIVCSIAVGYLFVVPTLNNVLVLFGLNRLECPNFDIAYLGGYCGFYVIVGYLIKKHHQRIASLVGLLPIVATAIFSTAASVVMHYMFVIKFQANVNPWYDSVFILMASTGLFIIMLSTLKHVKANPAWMSMSSAVLGVYLIQQIFIYIFVDKLNRFGLAGWPCYAAILTFVTICSVLTIAVIRRFPKLASAVGAKM